jgi:hypothetical protein
VLELRDIQHDLTSEMTTLHNLVSLCGLFKRQNLLNMNLQLSLIYQSRQRGQALKIRLTDDV